MMAILIVAQAKEHIKVQAVIGVQTTEVKTSRFHGRRYCPDRRRGSLKFFAVVGVKETLDAVDAGLVDGGFAWTHYWSGKHPAAMLFGSPVAGAGVGIDNIACFLVPLRWWRMTVAWDEMGMNVKDLHCSRSAPRPLAG